MPIRNIYEVPRTQARIRDGLGECIGATAFKADETQTPVMGVGMTIIPPGASIGPHAHGNEEEYYMVPEGQGLADLDGQQHRVKKGDVMLNVVFGTHGLLNDTDQDLVIFAFMVSAQ